MRSRTVIEDPTLGPLTDDRITRDYRVFQRAKGHRFSLDDQATAFVAWRAAPEALRVLDLGCGLGSVLLHLAWRMPEAAFVGVEVQASSFELLSRNIARNGLSERSRIHLGDLRSPETLERLGGGFDLVTGTPPYFPPGAATDALDEQRAFARVEYRGGIEDYMRAGARLVSSDGLMVICGDTRADGRVVDSAGPLGLSVCARCDVITRAGRPPLFSVWTFRLATGPREVVTTSITLHDEQGEPTADRHMLRAFAGFS